MKSWIKNVNLVISDDGMEAVFKIRKESTTPLPTLAELKDYLVSYGITYGVQEDALKAVLSPGAEGAVESHVVAKGLAAAVPEDDRIEYLFNFDEMGQPRIQDDGSVDLKDIQLILPVKKGDPLAKRIPGRFGSAGRTIRGEPIPIRAIKSLSLPRGLNTQIAPDNPNLIVAGVTGHVVKTGSAINVYETHVIPGDVDYSTGNVHYPGSLEIGGSIRSGFKVEVDGNLMVKRDIEDAQIECGGNLVVKGGIIGKMKNVINVAGDVEARFVNNHHVRALGDIRIQDECVNAKLECGGNVFVWKKGVLIGGEAFVFNRLDARVLGSESGAYTDVYFGLDTVFAKALAEMSKVKKDLLEKCMACRQGVYGILKAAVKSGREPTEAELGEIRRLKADLLREYASIGKIEQKEDKIVLRKNAAVSPGVTVRDMIFPGAKVAAATTSHFVRNAQKVRGTYILKGASIMLTPLS